MNQGYEFVFLTSPEMDEKRQEETFSQLEKQFQKANVEITDQKDWGEKKIVYPMKNNNSARFWIWHLNSSQPGFDISPVTLYLNRQDDVLRYLLLKKKVKE